MNETSKLASQMKADKVNSNIKMALDDPGWPKLAKMTKMH